MPGELGFTASFLGNTCLYAQVKPPFLERNQRSILRHLRLERELGRAVYDKRIKAMRNGMAKMRDCIRSWRTLEELHAASSDATLFVTPTTIGRCWREPLSPHVTESQVQRFACTIYCSIYHADDLSNPLYLSKKPATLVSLAENDPNVDIILEDTSFTADENELYPDEQARACQGDSVNSESSEGQLIVRLEIVCHNQRQRHSLYRLLDRLDPAATVNIPARRGIYVEFPLIGAQPQRVEHFLNAQSEGKIFRLDSKIHLSHEWRESSCSALEILNQSDKHESEAIAPQSTVDRMEVDSKTSNHELAYIFTGLAAQRRSIIRQDVDCGLCGWKNSRAEFDHLHWHLVNNHEHFKITETRQDISPDGCGTRRTILIDLKQEDRPAEKDYYLSTAVDFSWVRPCRPIDIRKYLLGDKTWVAEGLGKAAVGKDKNSIEGSREPQAPDSSAAIPKCPSKVQSVQGRIKKRWPVPDIPGVELYRTATKRKLQANELLSESEEDSEDDWATQRQRLQAANMPGRSRGRFFTLFDSHVGREDLASDHHLQDSVVRFCRRHRQQLAEPWVFADLRLKLQQLRRTMLLTPAYEEYCIDLVAGDMKPESTAETAAGGNVSKGKLGPAGVKAKRRNRAGQCLCGEVADGGWKTVWCSDERCTNEAFHMMCVGLTQLDRSWKCSDCTTREAP